VNLVHLVGEQVQAAGQLPLVVAQVGQLAARGVQAVYLPGQPLALAPQAAKAVEKIDMVPRLQQGDMIALAVDIHKMAAQVLQRTEGDRLAIGPAQAAVRPEDLPTQDQRAFLQSLSQPHAGQQLGERGGTIGA